MRTFKRPKEVVARDFFRKRISLGGATQKHLARYPLAQYNAVLSLPERSALKNRFNRVFVDPPEKVTGIDFNKLPDGFLLEQINSFTLDLRNLTQKLNQFRKRSMAVAGTSMGIYPPVKPAVEVRVAAPEIFIPDASKLLTDDLLYNSQSGVGYPRSAKEYHEFMRRILDAEGRFPGDTEPLTGKGTFSPKVKGVSHHLRKRRGINFQIEIFSPHLHAQGRQNRLIFDADLISQTASYDTYGTHGASYNRESYYVRRLWNAERVPVVRMGSWPVSFAAMQGYEMSFEGRDLYYAFIHFVMTLGRFQGYGLTSYLIREGMSSLFYSDVWRNRPNLMFDRDGNLKDYRFRMWAAAHSGRFAPFYAFVKGFGEINPSWDPIAHAIFQDVHARITPGEELIVRGMPEAKGAIRVNGGYFPMAADREVYPMHNRYPVINGRIVFPQSELDLPSSTREVWLKAIGGEEGVAAGNSLYFGGMVTLGKIRAAKKREKEREGRWLEDFGDRIRRWVVGHTK